MTEQALIFLEMTRGGYFATLSMTGNHNLVILRECNDRNISLNSVLDTSGFALSMTKEVQYGKGKLSATMGEVQYGNELPLIESPWQWL